jgi:hypothetical protein
VQLSGGIAIDSSGNIGTYTYYGAGVGVGEHVSGGVNVAGSNAKTICDLNGPFSNQSLGGGAGLDASVDTFSGSSNNGTIIGAGITLGAGLGLGGSSTITNTTVTPLGDLW